MLRQLRRLEARHVPLTTMARISDIPAKRVRHVDLRRTLRMGFIVPILLFLILGAVHYALLRTLLGEAAALRQSESVIAAGDQIRELAIDMETGVRGYLIAGDPRFLQPYHAGRKRLPGAVGTLAELVRDDARQQHHVSLIITDLRNWQQLAATMLVDPQGARPRQLAGKQAMDRARDDIDRLLVNEQRLREERARGVASLTRVVVGGSSVLALLCGLVVALATRRQLKEVAMSYDGALEVAEESLHLKDRFLATVSHELRTPMTTICGWAAMLRTQALDDETATIAVNAIDDSAKLQARLVEDLLDMTSAMSGKLRLVLTTLDLRAALVGAADGIRPAADAKNVNLTVNVPPVNVTIQADLQRVQQVMWNLLSNAIRFTPSGGLVTLELTRDQPARQAIISISDSGIGIDPRFLPHVFDQFTQADNTPSRSYGGLGLGLAIVRSLVELHGGSIEASSAGLTQGATFTIRLPLVTPPAPSQTDDGALLATSSS